MRQRNSHKWLYTNKVGSNIMILHLFTLNAITQSFRYLLFMSSVIRDHRELKAILYFTNNQKEVVMKRLTIIIIAVLLFIPVGTATQAQTDWRKYDGNPVLPKGPAGSWEDEGVFNPEVIFDGGTFKMWYGGDDGTNFRTGYATSTDGLVWTKSDSNPVMDLGAAGA